MDTDLIFEGIDLFAGAGGVTSGIEKAKADGKKIAYVVAAVNHDPLAIASHAANHKRVKHFIEDIRTLDVTHLPKPVSSENKRTFLWASLECTNFSNAKGGGPRDADSRTLDQHLYRYIEYLMPDYILIENVREFLGNGPLIHKIDKKTGAYCYDIKGNPVMIPESRTKGRDYIRWKNKIQSYGYEYDHRILDSADYGANTSRKRLFIIFARTGFPIVWPEATHSRTGENGLKKWRPVKECLDFQDKGVNIFGRKKPLSEKTYKRIYEGLIKFVANGDTSFLIKWLSNNPISGVNSGKSINDPCCVVTTQNRLGLIDVDFLTKYHGSGENILAIEKPCSTLTTKDRLAKIHIDKFTMTYYGGDGHIHSVDDPARSITTIDHHALVTTENFLNLYYSSGKQNQDIESPAGAILCKAKQSLVSVEKLSFIDEQYGASSCRSIEEPAGSLLTNPKQALVNCDPAWVLSANFDNVGKSIEDSAPTILTSNRHYLVNPQFHSKGSSMEDPCFTLIARMDKKPPYLVETEPGTYAIQISETDTPYMIKIKQFMACYGIVAILMRMLKVDELLKIQGFDHKYVLKGNQSEQKKFIGNAVPPAVVKAIFEALHKANVEIENEKRIAV